MCLPSSSLPELASKYSHMTGWDSCKASNKKRAYIGGQEKRGTPPKKRGEGEINIVSIVDNFLQIYNILFSVVILSMIKTHCIV